MQFLLNNPKHLQSKSSIFYIFQRFENHTPTFFLMEAHCTLFILYIVTKQITLSFIVLLINKKSFMNISFTLKIYLHIHYARNSSPPPVYIKCILAVFTSKKSNENRMYSTDFSQTIYFIYFEITCIFRSKLCKKKTDILYFK